MQVWEKAPDYFQSISNYFSATSLAYAQFPLVKIIRNIKFSQHSPALDLYFALEVMQAQCSEKKGKKKHN